ncbi:hypothetical protein GGR21_003799 [Dysgonomonas hofstadii]|uniref:MobA protein n=1 Tax=Dysgonomonas hofstadii TaxID=637886 RepID=A0A840CUL1_9BACT|nr:conjugal transfer protein MobA [Dysgonomonas hofstadii]MBB4037878.1 hypothetical protein [Dysgonomonas hofstadii]
MESNNPRKWKKGGRKPKLDAAVYRYSISFNSVENAKFLSLYEQSGAKNKAYFITACIFNRTLRVVRIDKSVQDYYMRLTTFFGECRAVGVNYNQAVKALNSNFSERKAMVLLYKLEQATIKLVQIQQKAIELTKEFNDNFFLISDRLCQTIFSYIPLEISPRPV